MDFPTKVNLPVDLSYERKSLVQMNKFNIRDLTICQPTVIQRERPLWREDRVDIVHAWPNGDVTHTPI